MMKRLLLFVLAMLLLCAGAGAEQITRTLSPDLSDAPWCEGVVFALDLEEPEGFPSPIPCYQTTYAQIDMAKLRALLAERGMEKPAGEGWYNGSDDVNRRNFVFEEQNNMRYHIYAYPWGLPVWTSDAQRQEEARAATEICRAFLEDAGITGVETPFYMVKRTADRAVYQNNDELLVEMGIDGNRFTGIGFRYTLGGLPVAVPGLYDPEQPNRRDGYCDSWGTMTVRDDGVITAFELTNYRQIKQELSPYAGDVIPWVQAVDAVLSEMIHWTTTTFGADGPLHPAQAYQRVTIKRAEAALAITPSGKTFPVWAIGLEIEESSETYGVYRYTTTQHVNAITGAFADVGEDMTP